MERLSMKVKELKEKINGLPLDAEIIINNREVQGIAIENGRMKDGWFGGNWLPLDRGNKKAIRFTFLTEFSDGQIGDSIF